MSRLWAERLVALSFIGLAGFMVTQSTGLPGRAGAFPLFAEYGIIALSLVILARTFLPSQKERLAGPVKLDLSYYGIKPFLVILVSVVYAYAMFKVGFYTASVVFFFIVAYLTGLRNFKLIALTAIILFPVTYLFFNVVLGARLPQGIWM